MNSEHTNTHRQNSFLVSFINIGLVTVLLTDTDSVAIQDSFYSITAKTRRHDDYKHLQVNRNFEGKHTVLPWWWHVSLSTG